MSVVLGLDRSSWGLEYLPTALVPGKVQLELYIFYPKTMEYLVQLATLEAEFGQRYRLCCVCVL